MNGLKKIFLKLWCGYEFDLGDKLSDAEAYVRRADVIFESSSSKESFRSVLCDYDKAIFLNPSYPKS